MPVSDAIRKKLSTLPHKPGVYLMRDRFGTVIYVGKARDLHRRVSQYFHPSRRLGWDLKFNALVDAIHSFDFHVVRSEPEALLLEGKLIKEFHPRYNVSFRDDKRFLLLKINLNDPIPNFAFARIKKDDGARYFGPFANSGALRRTLSLVRRQFNLRGCWPITPTEHDYKHCLYAHLKYCTAPCIGNVNRAQYLEQVQAACDFLQGQCREFQEQLEKEMQQAASAQDYERAAQIRDMLWDLQKTTKKTVKFDRVPYSLPGTIDPEKDLAELAAALGLKYPPDRIEGFDISNISGTFAVASMVSFRNGRPDRANYRRFKIKSVDGQDDFASMAEVVRRRYSRLLNESKAIGCNDDDGERIPEALNELMQQATSVAKSRRRSSFSTDASVTSSGSIDNNSTPAKANPRMPGLILIDGGKGQLSAALNELNKLGLSDIPMIGLAKEFEEIYRPGEKEPLRLAHSSGALKLLQRVRDESHRFANTYNAQLRLKRISESILDDFPGIGDRRKAALLKKFGSVQRLRLATVEQIAEVPGFGGKSAAELKAFLDARN